jgi:hypothetical protein
MLAIISIMILVLLLAVIFVVFQVTATSNKTKAVAEQWRALTPGTSACDDSKPVPPDCCKHGTHKGYCRSFNKEKYYDTRQQKWILIDETTKTNTNTTTTTQVPKTDAKCDDSKPVPPDCCKHGTHKGYCRNTDRKKYYDTLQKKWILIDETTKTNTKKTTTTPIKATKTCNPKEPVGSECCKYGEYNGLCVNSKDNAVFDPKQGKWVDKENACDKSAPRAPDCCRNGMYGGLCYNVEQEKVYDPAVSNWVVVDKNAPCDSEKPVGSECCKHGEIDGLCRNKELTHVYDPRLGIWTQNKNICDNSAPLAPKCCRHGMYMGMCLNADREKVYDPKEKVWKVKP